MKLVHTCITIYDWMLKMIDELVKKGEFSSRSEAIRVAISNLLNNYIDVLDTETLEEMARNTRVYRGKESAVIVAIPIDTRNLDG